MSLFNSLLKMTQRPLTEEEKLSRILESAAAQRSDLHLVFSQRLSRPVPVHGRFSKIIGQNILLTLNTIAIADVWDNEPCSIYFSVRCQELSGSYAFTTVMRAHDSQGEATRALVAMPSSYVERQVRRFERLAPTANMVHRLAVWQLRPQLAENSQAPTTSSLSRIAASQEPSLVQMLPSALRQAGPADFIYMAQQNKGCQLVNVSAGGARLRLAGNADGPMYNEGDNLLLLLALDNGKNMPPLMLTLAGACCNVKADDVEMDVKLRFTYWNGQRLLDHMRWAPVTLHGVSPLYRWVSHGLGIDNTPKTHEQVPPNMPEILNFKS